ncbi:MAG: hypothetical protein JW850_22350 [Thermoflexales bacterium]|nr:hypothetical protein [Thermoflexales bacterium]
MATTLVKPPQAGVKDTLINLVDELSVDRAAAVLEFALFMKERQAQQHRGAQVQPVQRLEELWGDFWPEDESVDDFVKTVQRWRCEDAALHRDLR